MDEKRWHIEDPPAYRTANYITNADGERVLLFTEHFAGAHIVCQEHNDLLDALEATKKRNAELEGDEGEQCQSCGRHYLLVWYAPDCLWERIMGRPGGLLCPDCFDARCREQGIYLEWGVGDEHSKHFSIRF